MAIVGYIALEEVETRVTVAPFHRGVMGYGSKIPTGLMIRENPGRGRWRRVYQAVFSNAPTSYIVSGKDWIVVR